MRLVETKKKVFIAITITVMIALLSIPTASAYWYQTKVYSVSKDYSDTQDLSPPGSAATGFAIFNKLSRSVETKVNGIGTTSVKVTSYWQGNNNLADYKEDIGQKSVKAIARGSILTGTKQTHHQAWAYHFSDYRAQRWLGGN
ncbi:MAG: hypothetical protein ACOX33_12180 [Dethiobacteria bacterium]